MENLKKAMCAKLVNDREQSVLEYNNRLEEVAYTENIPSLYSLIVYIYDDKEELDNAIIKLMGITLTNDFFRESFIHREENSIVFSNEEYKVHFYTNKSKIIELEYVATSNPWEVETDSPLLSNVDQEYNEKLKQLLEKYLNSKKFENFKELNELYTKESNDNIISKYFKTYKNCNQEMLNNVNKILKRNEERKNLKKLSLKIYDMKKDEAIKFLNTLTDMKIYKEAEWTFMISNEVHKGIVLSNDEINFNIK